jgi:hypothetical protein
MAAETSGPPGLRSANDPCGPYQPYSNNAAGIAGDFCERLHPDERNFLHNSKGERLYAEQSWNEFTYTLYLMNPGAKGWRTYFAEQARQNLETLKYSGLFVDNIDLSRFRAHKEQRNSDGTVREYADDAPYRAAFVGYLRQLRVILPEALIWGNMTSFNDALGDWDDYLPYLDGVMDEFFVARWSDEYADPKVWEIQLRHMRMLREQGKGFLAVAQGTGQHDERRLRFALASYLLVARGGAYFRYGDAQQYEQLWPYQDYQARLGRPLNDRYQTSGLWQRDFTCGYVTVDPERRVGNIVLDPYPRLWALIARC